MQSKNENVNIRTYSQVAIPQLEKALQANEIILLSIAQELIKGVEGGQSLFIFGSGHSSLLSLEIYHRAGGPSFVIPLVADYTLPFAGPKVVRMLERMEGAASHLLDRAQPRPGEMLWLVSQSGINSSVIDLALHAKRIGMKTVAFTSLVHSRGVPSRHPSGKKLYEICDSVVDLGGVIGDASIPLERGVSTGPLSSLTSVFLAHSILSYACAKLEEKRVRCIYTSVNTPDGEKRNQELEKIASERDPLLR